MNVVLCALCIIGARTNEYQVDVSMVSMVKQVTIGDLNEDWLDPLPAIQEAMPDTIVHIDAKPTGCDRYYRIEATVPNRLTYRVEFRPQGNKTSIRSYIDLKLRCRLVARIIERVILKRSEQLVRDLVNGIK